MKVYQTTPNISYTAKKIVRPVKLRPSPPSEGDITPFSSQRGLEALSDRLLREAGLGGYEEVKPWREALAAAQVSRARKFMDESGKINFQALKTSLSASIDIREVEPDVFSGQSLSYHPGCLNKLKKAGVHKIIYLGKDSGYRRLCNENGFKYVEFDFEDFNIDKAVKKKIRPEEKGYPEYLLQLKNNAIKIIEEIQEEPCYISCQNGTYVTDNTLLLVDFLNPKNKSIEDLIQTPDSSDFQELIRRNEFYYGKLIVLDDLAKITKKENPSFINWTPEFEIDFNARVKDAHEYFDGLLQ